MIATTSVPAIWAFTGLWTFEIIMLVYLGVVFVSLFAILWGLLYFARRVRRLVKINYD